MKLETWTMTVKVTVDLDAIGPNGWTADDVAQEIDSVVSQMEGVTKVECARKSYVAWSESPALSPQPAACVKTEL